MKRDGKKKGFTLDNAVENLVLVQKKTKNPIKISFEGPKTEKN